MRIIIFSTRLSVLLLPTLFLLTGCLKEKLIAPSLDPTPYRIQEISVINSYADEPDTIVYTFTYNSFGEPLTIKNPQVTTGNPNVFFQYDKSGRLIWMVRPYANGHFESWNKYFYNDRNQIVIDSQYVFGYYMDSIPVAYLPNGSWVRYYQYDDLGRIIQVRDSIDQGGFGKSGDTNTLTYDQSGDLVNSAVYDDHVSYRRTNAIWMFLSRDYSVHNAFKANSYNAYGLPLVFADPPYQILGALISGNMQFFIKYEKN